MELSSTAGGIYSWSYSVSMSHLVLPYLLVLSPAGPQLSRVLLFLLGGTCPGWALTGRLSSCLLVVQVLSILRPSSPLPHPYLSTGNLSLEGLLSRDALCCVF